MGIKILGDPNFQHSTEFVNGIVAVHNRERALVGSTPLVWDKTLAAGAKAWADHLTTTGELGHDPDIPPHEGESAANNLSYGPTGWVNETMIIVSDHSVLTIMIRLVVIC